MTCSECTECLVTCTSGFEVREKLLDIARLVQVPENFIL